MTRLMLDTNICVHALRNEGAAIRARLQRALAGDVAISTIVAAELWSGVVRSKPPDLNRRTLLNFLSFVKVLDWPAEAAPVYGQIRGDLETRGLSIGAMDLLIAAHAVSENAILVTDNVREFSRVTDLKVQNWIRR